MVVAVTPLLSWAVNPLSLETPSQHYVDAAAVTQSVNRLAADLETALAEGEESDTKLRSTQALLESSNVERAELRQALQAVSDDLKALRTSGDAPGMFLFPCVCVFARARVCTWCM